MKITFVHAEQTERRSWFPYFGYHRHCALLPFGYHVWCGWRGWLIEGWKGN